MRWSAQKDSALQRLLVQLLLSLMSEGLTYRQAKRFALEKLKRMLPLKPQRHGARTPE